MPDPAPSRADQTSKGIALMLASYAAFSLSDATVKWLVADFPVLQVLFARSLIVCSLAAVFGGRERLAGLARSRNKGWLVLTGVAVLGAFFCYFSAARDLGLAQLVTIYFAAPVIVAVLSVVVLRERVGPMRWIAIVVGFAGAIVAANPTGAVTLVPAGFALASALLWAISQLLIRKTSTLEPAFNQMVVSNLVFTLAASVSVAWGWAAPDRFSLMLMLALGVAGAVAQFLLYEAFRYAAASVLAPIEYTALLWAFTLGYLIWHDVPAWNVVVGAGLIVLGCAGLVWSERRRAHQPVLPNPSESDPFA
ncbi:MAG: DMT family transporter [Alsobacter sp.]